MDEEERNYCCLAILVTRLGADRIRHHFIRKWDDASIFMPWTDCAQNGTDLLTKFKTLPYENDKVKSGDTARWDLSLLVKVLLYTRPPFVTNPSLVKFLECLRETRNTLCHTPDGKIATTDFTKLWNDACNALVAFGATSDEFQKVERDVKLPLNELTSLMKQCAKQDDEILRGLNTIITQLTKLEQNQEDIKDKLDELASSTRQVQLSTEATISIKGIVKVLTAGGLAVSWAAGSAYIVQRYIDDPEILKELVLEAIIPTLFATVASVRAILPGSFKIVVEVRSLDALDAIWKSYMEGDMKKKLKKGLVTDEMRHLAPDDAESVDISLMISEDEYKKTRGYLVESGEGKVKQDIMHCMKELAIAEQRGEKGDQEMIAQCYQRLGECYRVLQWHSEAVTNYKQSLSNIFSPKMRETLEGDVSYGLGVSLMELYRFQESKQCLDKALIIANQVGLKLEWKCIYALSDLHNKQSQFHKALDYAERAEDIANKMNSTEEKQLSYQILSHALVSLGRVKDAIEYDKQYLKYTQQVGNRKEEGRTFFGLSVCYEKIHDYDNAKGYAEKSAKIAKEIGDLKTEGNAYGIIGGALSETGKLREAIENYKKALEIARQSGDKESEATAYNNLGVSLLKLGKNYDAIMYFETSVNLYSELGLLNNNGAQYHNLGALYYKVGKYHEAAEFLKLCLDIAKDTGEISIEISAYQYRSDIYYKTNNAKLASECRWKSIILAIRTGDKCGEMKYFQWLGIFFGKHDKIKAITSEKKALGLALKIKLSDYICNCYEILGTTYFQFGMMYEAIHVSEKALKICTDSGLKENEALYRHNMGKIYYGLSRKQKLCNDHEECARNIKTSEQYFRESLHCYEENFDDLREKHEFKISIVDTYVEAYNNLASLLINTNRTTEALIVCERGRACALGDFLVCKYDMQQQQVFVENMSARNTLNESDLTDLLPKESSLLFYCIIDDNEHLWVLSQQRSLIYAKNNMQQNSITNKNITKYIKQLVDSAYQSMHVRQMTANCEDRSLGKQEPCYNEGNDDRSQLINSIERMTLEQDIIDSEYSRSSRNPTESTSIGSNQDNDTKEPLKELFKQLITPVEEHLTHDEIIIIPDGPLNMVPFAALQDPQTGRFLCESKRIRLVPSLTTLKILKECSDNYHSKEGALVIGNPLVGKVMFRGEEIYVTRLSAAERNALVVSKILSDILKVEVSPLIGKAATKYAVKEKLKEGAAVIHIAAHGDDTTGKIALAPGKSAQSKDIPEEEDYILTMQEVQEIGVRAKLVVLSCCHSGRGEIRAEGVVCMARAFLAAGARCVVASLWAINAKATVDFMRHFYVQLRCGKSASVSLNNSMKKMINGDKYGEEKRYSDPKYWAPFFLIGDDVTIC